MSRDAVSLTAATRSAPAHLLMHGDRPILIDCGEGAMRQLKRAGIDFRQIKTVATIRW